MILEQPLVSELPNHQPSTPKGPSDEKPLNHMNSYDLKQKKMCSPLAGLDLFETKPPHSHSLIVYWLTAIWRHGGINCLTVASNQTTVTTAGCGKHSCHVSPWIRDELWVLCVRISKKKLQLGEWSYMGVSWNGGTPISHPKMIIFSREN